MIPHSIDPFIPLFLILAASLLLLVFMLYYTQHDRQNVIKMMEISH